MYACKHCLGGDLTRTCIHCRERRAELSGQRRHSQLSDADRAALEIFPSAHQTWAAKLRRMMIPVKPQHRTSPETLRRHSTAALGNSVLPASFNLI